MLLTTIVQDLKHANQKSKNPRLNRMVQGLLFGMVERGMQLGLHAPKFPPKPKAA